MRKRLKLLVCSTLLLTLLGGCSESNSEKEENSTTENVKVEDESVSKEDVKVEDESVSKEDEGGKIINPIVADIDINNLDNCTVAVSMEKGDAYVDDTGKMQMDLTVYNYDVYDMVDMAELKEGDTIVIQNKEVKVTSLERNDIGIIINGGLENNGYDFKSDDSTVWFVSGYDDCKFYFEVGKITLRVSEDMVFHDNSDLDVGEVTYYPGDFLSDESGFEYHFVPNNTSVVIEDGMIIEMNRCYIP